MTATPIVKHMYAYSHVHIVHNHVPSLTIYVNRCSDPPHTPPPTMFPGIAAVNLAIVAVSLGIARAMGITVPHFRVWLPFDKEFVTIIALQIAISYLSAIPARLLTEQPARYKGDVDGILDNKLLVEKRNVNQALVLLTMSLTTVMLIVGHTCCHDGIWTGTDPSRPEQTHMLVYTLIGEPLWALYCGQGQSAFESSQVIAGPDSFEMYLPSLQPC